MNRYTASALLDAAAEGRRILIIEPHGRAVTDTLAEFDADNEHVARVTHANGRAGIATADGGVITIRTIAGARGCSADTVYLDTGVDESRLHRDDLRAVIATSPTGEIIRA